MAHLTQVTADALEWVSAELGSSLGRIGQLIESYLEDPQEKLPLQRALSETSQVRGTLLMIQCFGAAIVADEAHQVLRDLVAGNVERAEEAFESVLSAVLQLSDYLDVLSRGVTDSVLIFQPLINELRAARGAPVLGEADLFVRQTAQHRPQADLPDLSGRNAGAVLAAAKRFHPAFQAALLQWLKDEDVELNLRRLGKIAEQLHGLTIDADVYELWWMYAAVVEGVLIGGIEAVAPIKRLSGQMAQSLKKLAEADEEASVDVPQELYCRLLYHIQRSTSRGNRENAVRNAYSIADMLPDEAALVDIRQRLRGPNSDLIGKLSQALKEDLAAVKDSIDLLVRAGAQAPGDMDELMDLCARISNTLAMLGLNQLQRRLLGQMETLDAIRRRDSVDESEWMEVATALVEIEQHLDSALAKQMHGVAGAANDDGSDVRLDAHAGAVAIFRESLVNIARIKESVREFIESGEGGEGDGLANCERWLNEVEAGLAILNKSEGVQLFARLRQAQALARPRLAREPVLAGQLAEVVAALEWYLEALSGAHGRGAADPAVAIPYLEHFEATLAQSQGEDAAVVEPAVEVVAATTGDDDADVDPEIREIFLEEAGEVQVELERRVPGWNTQPGDRDSLITLRRAFHTLKGSGRMVGANAVGEFSWALEHMLNQCLDGSLEVSPPVVEAVNEAVDLLPGLIESFRDQRPADPRVAALADTADAIARGHALESDADVERVAAPNAELVQIFHKDAYVRLRVVERFLDDHGDERPDLNAVTRALHTVRGSAELAGAQGIANVAGALEHCLQSMAAAGISVSDQTRTVIRAWIDFVHQALDELSAAGSVSCDPGPVLARIDALNQALPQRDHHAEAEQEGIRVFAEEALDLLEQCESHFDAWYGAPDDRHHPEAVAGVMDALADSAMRAGVQVFVDVCRAVAGCLWFNLRDPEPTDPALIHTLHEVLDGLYDLLDRLHLGERVTDASAILELLGPEMERQCASDVTAPVEESDGQVAEDVTVESLEAEAEQTPAAPEDVTAGFSDAGMKEQAPVEPEHGQDRMPPDQHPQAEEDTPSVGVGAAAPATIAVDAGDEASAPMDEPERRPAISAEPTRDESDIDPELRAIFSEEATELLEAIDGAVAVWQDDLVQTESRSELQRLLHTLKGSARMARVQRIGDVSHELETYIAAIEQHEDALSAESVAVVRYAADAMHAMVEQVTAGKALDPADDLIAILAAARVAVMRGEMPSTERLQDVVAQTPEGDIGENVVRSAAAAPDRVSDKVAPEVFDRGDFAVENDIEAGAGNRDADRGAGGETAPAQTAVGTKAAVRNDGRWAAQLFWQPLEDQESPRQGSGETARVPVDSLDHMLNEGGEISIFRSRLEQENTSFRFQLREMSQTIARIAEQLHKLNLETETSMLARHQGGAGGVAIDDRYGDEFDPLELDRYTHVQELSRALAEGLNDLSSLHGLMEQSARETDSLLVQQARVNTSLQQRLMRALMVPFSRQVSRLDRVVRQTATEYGRDVALRVRGESHELDRNVLQRMIAPLEHLLRNAVVHGIESTEERARAGKPEHGNIDLLLWRDGSQLVIELRDDGRGLDLSAIRRKAESRRMLTPGQQVSDETLANLIFERGFTTADRLTQSAGRGVGMDVVNAEIKQLSGSIQISSIAGKGARFEIRLPLSLAINQALLVRVGDETYAVPLRSIEGITRIERETLMSLFEDQHSTVSYGGYDYAVGYLGDVIGLPRPDPASLPEHISLLLVRVGEQHTAIAVDVAVGGREVVVKSVGPQVSTVAGVNGATILADGHVVLILDVAALLSDHGRLLGGSTEQAEAVSADRHLDARPLVLVVDDSITVRRVSERLLTRSGYRVALARDGMDALAKLQVEPPSVVLLDIEMPRIDGFEVATYIRNTDRLREVPIIMLTSRSGEKHRQRARQIGVNSYLIKPYQEEELLSEIRTLIRHAPAVAETI